MVASASNRNEHQEDFLGVKVAGAIVMKSGNLNFLDPFGPLLVQYIHVSILCTYISI